MIHNWNEKNEVIHLTVKINTVISVNELLSYFKKENEQHYQMYLINEKRCHFI